MDHTSINDDEIIVKVNGHCLARFEGIDQIQGEFEEFDPPNEMSAEQLIHLARWLLNKAVERARRDADK